MKCKLNKGDPDLSGCRWTWKLVKTHAYINTWTFNLNTASHSFPQILKRFFFILYFFILLIIHPAHFVQTCCLSLRMWCSTSGPAAPGRDVTPLSWTATVWMTCGQRSGMTSFQPATCLTYLFALLLLLLLLPAQGAAAERLEASTGAGRGRHGGGERLAGSSSEASEDRIRCTRWTRNRVVVAPRRRSDGTRRLRDDVVTSSL